MTRRNKSKQPFKRRTMNPYFIIWEIQHPCTRMMILVTSIHFFRKPELNPRINATRKVSFESNISIVQKGSIILLFSIIIIFNDFQTNPNKEQVPHNLKEQRCQSKWNLSNAKTTRNTQIHQLPSNTSKYTQNTSITSIFVHTKKRTTTSLFTFNSN